ncbi:MAG: hypothetical protein AABX96_02430 [Nanoarchaeota archaeon]
MKRGLRSLPEQTAMDLTFRTIPLKPSEKYVSLQFLPDTIWQISRRDDGIYLYQNTGGESSRDYLLSSSKDNGISKLSPLIIKVMERHFIIPYNNEISVLYSPDGNTYFRLGGSRDFMEAKEHHFSCGGSLHFVLSLKPRIEKPRFSQLELFPRTPA